MHPDIMLLFDNYFVSKYNSCTLQVLILNIREDFFVKESKLRLRSAGLLSSAPISQSDYPEAYSRLLDGKQGDAIFDYKEGDVDTMYFTGVEITP